MTILGISAFYHDAAAAIICDGTIVAAAQEERFTRIKHDPAFPSKSIRFCLDTANCSIDDLDAVVFYDKPFLKFERILETYYAFAPRGLFSFLRSMPIWIKDKIFLKRNILHHLAELETFSKKKIKILFPEHHLSHAASAFYPSPFEESAILTIDGVGEWATASICYGKENQITILKELDFPHSLGLLYSSFTYYCGFKVNSGEYKLMGLAPYGNENSTNYHHYISVIKDKLIHIQPDGSVFLEQKYFNYTTGLRMVKAKVWHQLFNLPRRLPETALLQEHCDLALAIQRVTEEIILLMAAEAQRLSGSDHLCLAGGVALNAVANGKIMKSKLFKKIFIQPAAGDAGGALGAALAAHHIYFNKPVSKKQDHDTLQGALLGTAYTDQEIINAVSRFGASYKATGSFLETCQVAAELLNTGNILGWFQGRMEFGPRALGGRSIIADARRPDMQKRLNLKIKHRESFRPFAPAVLAEEANEYFEPGISSPYMLLVAEVKKSRQLEKQPGFHELPLMDKLYTRRSDLPAITHVDNSARIQTVNKETNFSFWQLLSSFKDLTGCAVLINTSFNVRGEPIVESPENAYRCFMQTDMDYLIMGNLVFEKAKQPVMDKQHLHQHKFEAD